MNLDSVIFIDSLPKLDLHGFDADTARVLIEDYIRENKHMKQPIFVIIHGIGSGKLRDQTRETLKRNKLVVEFKTYYYNQGCTLVRIQV